MKTLINKITKNIIFPLIVVGGIVSASYGQYFESDNLKDSVPTMLEVKDENKDGKADSYILWKDFGDTVIYKGDYSLSFDGKPRSFSDGVVYKKTGQYIGVNLVENIKPERKNIPKDFTKFNIGKHYFFGCKEDYFKKSMMGYFMEFYKKNQESERKDYSAMKNAEHKADSLQELAMESANKSVIEFNNCVDSAKNPTECIYFSLKNIENSKTFLEEYISTIKESQEYQNKISPKMIQTVKPLTIEEAEKLIEIEETCIKDTENFLKNPSNEAQNRYHEQHQKILSVANEFLDNDKGRIVNADFRE